MCIRDRDLLHADDGGMNPKETNQYYEYLGKSLNPGYGVADLNTTEKIKGLENCAK